MPRLLDHVYIFGMILFTVYSQTIMRWQVALAGELPNDFSGKVFFVANLFLNPWIISSVFATFFAGVSWMLAMSRFEISYAYPWVGLNFVFMLVIGVFAFGESFSIPKGIGTFLIVLGVFVMARN